jgi:hypothetical protein
MGIKSAMARGLNSILEPGLVLINTTSFSGVSIQSINDVFSATYANYRILYTPNQTNDGSTIAMRLRVAGADNSSSNYNFSFLYQSPGVANTPITNRENNAQGSPATSWYFCREDSDGGSSYSVIDVFNPFATKKAALIGKTVFSDNANGQLYSGEINGNMTVATSYTGFTLISGTGNMDGTVSVYGYNQ